LLAITICTRFVFYCFFRARYFTYVIFVATYFIVYSSLANVAVAAMYTCGLNPRAHPAAWSRNVRCPLTPCYVWCVTVTPPKLFIADLSHRQPLYLGLGLPSRPTYCEKEKMPIFWPLPTIPNFWHLKSSRAPWSYPENLEAIVAAIPES